MKSRFIYIIFAIILVLLVNPFIRPLGLIGHLFSTLLLSMIPLASAYALTEDRKKAIIVLLIAAPFVILDALNVFFTNRPLMIVAYSFGTISLKNTNFISKQRGTKNGHIQSISQSVRIVDGLRT